MREKMIPAVPARTVYEQIIDINISYLNRTVVVTIVTGTVDKDMFVAEDGSPQKHILPFDDLMADKPEWAVNKPKNAFRLDDIFALVDITKAKRDQQRAESDAEAAKLKDARLNDAPIFGGTPK